jgi:hypothetical protein
MRAIFFARSKGRLEGGARKSPIKIPGSGSTGSSVKRKGGGNKRLRKRRWIKWHGLQDDGKNYQDEDEEEENQ